MQADLHLFCSHNWAEARQNPQNDLCTQSRLRSARAFAQSDQSSLGALCVGKDPMLLYADSEYSDQTGQILRLIWVFTGRISHCVGSVMLRLIWHCHDRTHTSCEPLHEKNCLMPYANNKGADQPAHQRRLISAFIAHCLVKCFT